jgi:seryl-tRNA synthetase
MIDIDIVKNNLSYLQSAYKKRGYTEDLSELVNLNDTRKKYISEVEELKSQRNKMSKKYQFSNEEEKKEHFGNVKALANNIKKLDSEIAEIAGKIQYILDRVPNIPDDDVVGGGKENNEVIKVWGEKPEFNFKPKSHIDLCKDLGLIDYERGVKIGGSNFWMYRGKGALLEWALINYFIEEHLKDGYELVFPPHLLTSECGYTAGQFPKFQEDVFYIDEDNKEDSKHFLLPTAETALVNIHRNEILPEEDLPKKYFSYTPCFRKEAGSYRSDERGMIRGHQFNKVEMFQYTKPEDSNLAFEELIGKAENLVKKLGLHYRLSKLAAGDCSHSMAKTYDIEVWIPSMNQYKEVSSVSNAKDYQARRGKIRFKRQNVKKSEFVHTLNASGLATSRLFPAIIEQFQQEDSSIKVPEILQKWLGKSIK